VIDIAAGLRRILAPNPSPMTYRGTNTYVLGTTDLAVIDPGPDDTAHLKAILAAVQPGQRISHILVTHSHLDHSPLARPLADATGAPIFAYGGPQAGRSAVMQQLADTGLAGGGEGIDHGFAADVIVQDGDTISADGWEVAVLWTPGHLGNHISFVWQDTVFTGDHVMGWASSLVSPPDGDLTQFMASCARLQSVPAQVYYPGHGAPVTDPAARLEWLITHRKSRESAILAALQNGPARADQLAAAIYTETPAALQGAATRNVLAHLIDLMGQSRVAPHGPLGAQAEFGLTRAL
jgi:glyoxylase-like metal-dependent hydrolase (beta-lactamase superfamily II)